MEIVLEEERLVDGIVRTSAGTEETPVEDREGALRLHFGFDLQGSMRDRSIGMAKGLLFLLLAAACGKEPAGPVHRTAPATGADDISALLPGDVMIVMRFSSPGVAGKVLGGIGRALQMPIPRDAVGSMARFTGVDSALVDRTRPMAIVASATGLAKPTFIVPVTDVEQALAQFKGRATATRGSYVALAMSPGYEPGPTALGRAMPDAAVAVRIDLERFLSLFRANIDAVAGMVRRGLEGNAPDGARPAFHKAMGGLGRLLDAAQVLEVTLDLEGSRLEARLALTVAEGSPLVAGEASGVAALAGSLPAELPFVALMRLDPADWSPLVPDALARELLPELGREWLLACDFRRPLKAVLAVRAADPGALLERVAAAVAPMGIETVAQEKRRLRLSVHPRRLAAAAGVHERELVALLGPQQVLVDAVAAGDRVLFGTGVDLRKRGQVPPSVGAALRKAGGAPSVLLCVELRALMQGLAERTRERVRDDHTVLEKPKIPGGKPVPVVAYLAGEGRVWRAGLSVDLEAAAKVLEGATRAVR